MRVNLNCPLPLQPHDEALQPDLTAVREEESNKSIVSDNIEQPGGSKGSSCEENLGSAEEVRADRSTVLQVAPVD